MLGLLRRSKVPRRFTDEQLERFVDNGVRLLDHERPGWRADVDPDLLNVSEHVFCVLGQLYGTYDEGVRRLRLRDLRSQWEHGFAIPLTSSERRLTVMSSRVRYLYARLTETWLQRLDAERELAHIRTSR